MLRVSFFLLFNFFAFLLHFLMFIIVWALTCLYSSATGYRTFQIAGRMIPNQYYFSADHPELWGILKETKEQRKDFVKAEVTTRSSVSSFLQRCSFSGCIVLKAVIFYSHSWKPVSPSDTFVWEGEVCSLETGSTWSASLCCACMYAYICNTYSLVNFRVEILEILFFKHAKQVNE